MKENVRKITSALQSVSAKWGLCPSKITMHLWLILKNVLIAVIAPISVQWAPFTKCIGRVILFWQINGWQNYSLILP
jgi:hypothetical protein